MMKMRNFVNIVETSYELGLKSLFYIKNRNTGIMEMWFSIFQYSIFIYVSKLVSVINPYITKIVKLQKRTYLVWTHLFNI